MKENIIELVKLGKIPNDKDMSNEVFNRYDSLLQFEDTLTYEEAEQIIVLFSDDCDDLNWNILHAVETVDFGDISKYIELIKRCNNSEYREILEKRLNNILKEKYDEIFKNKVVINQANATEVKNVNYIDEKESKENELKQNTLKENVSGEKRTTLISDALEDILGIEKEYDCKFSEEFKIFFSQYNGGKLVNREVALESGDWKSSTRFHGFYGIKKKISEALKDVVDESWWVEGFTPFGYDEGGESFCISTRYEDFGAVYYFMSDCIDEDDKEEAFLKVAESFVEFINRMI